MKCVAAIAVAADYCPPHSPLVFLLLPQQMAARPLATYGHLRLSALQT